eukprot:g29844.t1
MVCGNQQEVSLSMFNLKPRDFMGSGINVEDSQSNSLMTVYHCSTTSAGSALLVRQDISRDRDGDDGVWDIVCKTGVKQGCVIATTLFSMYLAAMLHLTANKFPAGVELTDRTSGKLFNLHCLEAKMKVTPSSVIELQYADSACIRANSEDELQSIISTFTEAYEYTGPTPNICK